MQRKGFIMKDDFWTHQIREWISKRREATPDMPEQFIEFFKVAFANTHYPQQAWFGAHRNTLSLVVGGIFLAAVVAGGKNKGIWLLVDRNLPNIEGVEFEPVKSTQRSATPLVWAHAKSLEAVTKLLKARQLWKSYAQASEKIMDSPVSHDRDRLQIERGKRRLRDFWINGNQEL